MIGGTALTLPRSIERIAAWVSLTLAVGVCAPHALAQEAAEEGRVSAPNGSAPHVPGTVISVELRAGDYLVAGTCGLPGTSYDGDTTLRLDDASGRRVAFNDDACDGLGSRLEYLVPPGGGGTHSITAGCYGEGASCSGTIAYAVGDAPFPPPPEELPVVRVVAAARGAIALGVEGGALIADAMIEWRPLPQLAVRLGGVPLGLGGGALGGIAAGSLHLIVAASIGEAEIGFGGGAAVLASRFGDVAGQETGVFVTHARLGRLSGFHVEGQISVAEVGGEVRFIAANALMRLALPGFDLALRGAGGHDGVVLGEAVLVLWLLSEEDRPTLGVSFHAGGAGVFYEPLCRFGAACAGGHWYAGPSLGLGLEWRPGLAR